MDIVSRNSNLLFRRQIFDLDSNFQRKFDYNHFNDCRAQLNLLTIQLCKAGEIGLTKRFFAFR